MRSLSRRSCARVAASVLFLAGCGHTFPRPFTAAAMVADGSGAALADYLSQDGATPAVCHRAGEGPFIGPLRDADIADLTDALVNGTVPPDVWQRCASSLLRGPPSPETVSLLDTMGRAYRKLLKSSDFVTKPELQKRLEALHETFQKRPSGVEPDAKVMAGLLEDLRSALTRGKLVGPAKTYADDLLVTVDLGSGLYEGAPVTVAVLDTLAAAKNEAMLRRFALRLPDPALVAEARRRVIRLHIEASTWPEVKDHPADVEAAVLATGHFAVDLASHPSHGATIDAARLPVRGVLVQQRVAEQTALLLAYRSERPGVSLMPELPVAEALRVEFEGISSKVTACATPEMLDVTPCFLPKALGVESPLVSLDERGRLHFVEGTALAKVVSEVNDQLNLPLPLTLAGKPVFRLEWPVYFARPEDMRYQGVLGGPGPNLAVTLEPHPGGRLFFHVTARGNTLLAVVERRDAADFVIASEGGDGVAGTHGRDGHTGSSGSDGNSGSCPGMSGGNGGNGGPGENGGDGGDGLSGGPGGNVKVELVCGSAGCPDLDGLARRVVRSLGGHGGAGGSGGRGGSGGSGGRGGSGASCTDSNGVTQSVSGGQGGSNGPSGRNGRDGTPGTDGPPGRVTFVTR